jgi:hypothetical protein
MVVKVIIVVFSPLGEHGGTDALDSMFSKPIHVLPHLPVVRRRQRVTRMVTVPDDLHREHQRVIVNLHQSFQRALHLLVLLLDIVGCNLPVSFRLGEVRGMDPSAPLTPEVTMNIISSPSDNDQDRECGATLKPVLPLDLLNELPNLMVNRREPLSPLQTRIN